MGPKLRRWIARMATFLAAGALLLIVIPHIIDASPEGGMPAIHGEWQGETVKYEDVSLADILTDIDRLTGFRAVAFPAVGERRYTGSLPIPDDGKEAAANIAASLGLKLERVGPHWVLADTTIAQK